MSPTVRISNGVTDHGLVVGNAYDKYASRNPIVRWMMDGFHAAIRELVSLAAPSSVFEVGCGEGYWVLHWNASGISAAGCDVSEQVISIARENAAVGGVDPAVFGVASIYDLSRESSVGEMVVCCEVLEHLEDPRRGLESLRSIASDYVLLSVPREPLWCALNLCRAKYIRHLGNTPGHIQHWSRQQFVLLVSEFFDVIEVRSPLPWTMVLARVR